MSLNGISQIEIIDSIDQNATENDITLKSRDSFEISERSKGELEDLSSRIDIWDEHNTRKISRKSFMLLAKNYPNYHHYSYKVGLLNRYHRISEPYAVLPEIKGHTMNNTEREHHNLKQIPNNISFQINTLQDLTNNILKYGSKSDNVWMKFSGSRNGQKLVRPGFSARRYMANLVRHLNDNLVEKLIADGKVLEKTIFQNSIILPHIRRRLSADLSRYPEPYRILKQMLISPGPLNEYSFIWKKSNYLTEEMPSSKMSEMNIGDIKILSKKSLGDNTDIFEEVQYAQMSHEKKKTVLSNLLLKSAMNHALKMKEEIVVHNSRTIDKSSKENVHNIHIPIINFDMMEAVTDLLNKETFAMLSSNDVSLIDKTGFKGQALRTNYAKRTPHSDVNENIMSETNDGDQIVSLDQVDNDGHSVDLVPINLIPNLTLRLNPTNVNRLNHKRKEPKIESHSEQQSSLSNYQNAVISFDPSNLGLPDYQSQMEAQSNAFVERLKNKTGKSGVSHQAKPYGRYRDTEEIPNDRDSNAVGDIDPTSSFKNWKYEESKHTNSEFGKGFDSSSLSSSGNFTNNSLFNSKLSTKVSKGKLIDLNPKSEEDSPADLSVQNDQNRLFHLLNEHADTVAETVLRNSGGEDFASDVKEAVIQWNEILKERYFELFSYVAIMEILQQKKSLLNQSGVSNGQIWNVDVQDIHNEEEYGGMIKNIFKSLFKEQLDGVTNDDVNISPEIMLLLRDGSKLAFDNIEVKIDSTTGKTVISLKEEVVIKRETVSQIPKENDNNLSRNMNYFKLSNADTSETLPLSQHQNVSQIFSSPSSIIITPTWDEGILFNENKGNLSNIVEEGLKSELKSSSDIKGKSNQNLSKSNNLQENSNSSHDAQNSSTPLSYNQTPLVKFDGNLIPEQAGQRSGDKSDLMSSSEATAKKLSSLAESEKNNLSTSLKNELHKSASKKSKQEFIVGRIDDTKDVMTLYSQSPEKLPNDKIQKQPSQKQLGKIVKQKSGTTKKSKQDNQKSKQDNQKSKKKVVNRIYNDSEPLPLAIKSEIINKIEVVEPKIEAETLIEKEDNESIELPKESSNHSLVSVSKSSQDMMYDKYDDNDMDQIDEDASGDDEESKQRKILMRQQREAKRKADADKRRLEVERKRREREEQRISELKRKELEESLAKKLEEERRQREEEYRLKIEKEKADELLRMEALNQEEYLRQKQIERERKEKEEFNKRLEEMRMKQALEDQKRKLEQERIAFEESERVRIENEMISRMRENERILYLKKKAEEEERKRLKEEEEKILKEEQARLALEEAQRIVQQQARERAELEARLNFIKGLRIENAGLKKFLNITPNFVWSYFEFLKILGLQSNPTTNKLESEKNRTP